MPDELLWRLRITDMLLLRISGHFYKSRLKAMGIGEMPRLDVLCHSQLCPLLLPRDSHNFFALFFCLMYYYVLHQITGSHKIYIITSWRGKRLSLFTACKQPPNPSCSLTHFESNLTSHPKDSLTKVYLKSTIWRVEDMISKHTWIFTR